MLNIDVPIRSNDYYKKNYNVDLLTKEHDMNHEIQIDEEMWQRLNSSVNINIQGQRVSPKNNQNRFYRSKKLGINEYYIGVDKLYKMEKQIGGFDCWAACLKYIILYKTGMNVSQKKIIEEFKSKNEQNVNGATVIDIMSMLGYSNLRLTENGSMHLIESLGENQPVIVGIKEKDMSNHAVVVTGARYSFVNSTIPSLAPSGEYSFIEFEIMDPKKGNPEKIKAIDLENNINFVLSFNPL